VEWFHQLTVRVEVSPSPAVRFGVLRHHLDGLLLAGSGCAAFREISLLCTRIQTFAAHPRTDQFDLLC
jgi:hypothetical protein